jgi:hypothetical protein
LQSGSPRSCRKFLCGQNPSQLLLRGTEYRRQDVAGGSTELAAWQAGIDLTLQNADAIVIRGSPDGTIG